MPFISPKSDPDSWATSAGKVTFGINGAGQLCTKDENGTITPVVTGAPGVTSYVNLAGNTAILPVSANQTSTVDVQNNARTVNIIPQRQGAVEGGNMRLVATFPAQAGFVLKIYDDQVAPSNLLDTFTTDGAILSAIWFLYFYAGKWNLQMSKAPAY